MFLIKSLSVFKALKNVVRFYSFARSNHYEVLKLKRNCTEKEIKDAFIQMSKEYHPDKNKDAKAQEKFVRILEAYNVLSKPSSRAQYDSFSDMSTTVNNAYDIYKSHAAYNTRNNSSYGFNQEYYQYKTNYSSNKSNDNYYGVKGVKKLPNTYIIGVCFGVAILGVLLQVYVIRNMYSIHRKQAQERSQHIAEELDKVRAAAKDNGNELQTRLLLDKIVSAANPTVTTASLGQALANEKKEKSETLLTEFGIAEPDIWYEEAINPNMKTYNVKISFETG